ncbi:MAG: oxidoreductase of aldo/keto reductase family, subgroup 1 [Labilithrix sp.]|nr:oxidoreductase of aldo/keto reductase family, subgroup 1 [Labilithrix sp.]
MTTLDVTTATRPLLSGGTIPQVGLGVWQSPRGAVTRDAVLTALRHGYRHVDTARIYGNEKDVGAAVRESGIPREEIFVTTKLWNEDHGYDAALGAFDASLERLGLEYVDLYLIHWPVPGKRKDTWRAMERIKAGGRAKHIGVSNYLVKHLEELLADATEPPEVDQIEIHPFLQHRETRAFCNERRIVVEAYSPLTRGEKLDHPVVQEVAKRLKRTPAQVLLRWGIEHGLVVLPKSTHEKRIVENAALFDFALDTKGKEALDGLDEGLATGWDPRTQK